jgi:hypothetical protein
MGQALHGAGTDTNDGAVEMAKSAGFISPRLAAVKLIKIM